MDAGAASCDVSDSLSRYLNALKQQALRGATVAGDENDDSEEEEVAICESTREPRARYNPRALAAKSALMHSHPNGFAENRFAKTLCLGGSDEVSMSRAMSRRVSTLQHSVSFAWDDEEVMHAIRSPSMRTLSFSVVEEHDDIANTTDHSSSGAVLQSSPFKAASIAAAAQLPISNNQAPLRASHAASVLTVVPARSSSLHAASRPLSDTSSAATSLGLHSSDESIIYRGSISPPGSYASPSLLSPASASGGSGVSFRRRPSFGSRTSTSYSPRSTDDHEGGSFARSSSSFTQGSSSNPIQALRRRSFSRTSDGDVAIDSGRLSSRKQPERISKIVQISSSPMQQRRPSLTTVFPSSGTTALHAGASGSNTSSPHHSLSQVPSLSSGSFTGRRPSLDHSSSLPSSLASSKNVNHATSVISHAAKGSQALVTSSTVSSRPLSSKSSSSLTSRSTSGPGGGGSLPSIATAGASTQSQEGAFN